MNILDCIGNTPLLYLPRISRIAGANIYAKVETYNPSGSIKDRVALYYLQESMKKGDVKTNRCIIEAATGNLGISLAYVCSQLDLRFMDFLPSSVLSVYHSYLKELGVHVILADNAHGMQGALDKAAFHHEDTWGSFRVKPYTNQDGVKCYYEGLGQELINDAEKESLSLDAFICGVETGATFTGVGKRLKEKNPSVFLGATELTERPDITGDKSIFIESEKSSNNDETWSLTPVFDRSLISETYSITKADAMRAQKRLLSLEGIRACSLSGANVHAALLLAQNKEFQGKNIFVVVHDLNHI